MSFIVLAVQSTFLRQSADKHECSQALRSDACFAGGLQSDRQSYNVVMTDGQLEQRWKI